MRILAKNGSNFEEMISAKFLRGNALLGGKQEIATKKIQFYEICEYAFNYFLTRPLSPKDPNGLAREGQGGSKCASINPKKGCKKKKEKDQKKMKRRRDNQEFLKRIFF